MGTNTVSMKTVACGLAGNSGNMWDEGIFEKLLYICVSHSENCINSIQFVYKDKQGKIVASPTRGGRGQNFDMIEIKSPITKVSGSYRGSGSQQIISNLKIETDNYCYGAFGRFNPDHSFSFNARGGSVSIKGFHGYSDGMYLMAIGVHIVADVNAAEGSSNSKPEGPKVKSEFGH